MAIAAKKQRSKLGVKLGRNIFERRKELGWTQAELAEKIGVDTETISRFERGSNLPSLSRLETLAEILDVSLSKLITQSSHQPNTQAEVITEWISALESCDREFVMDALKRLCFHLSHQKIQQPKQP